MSFLKNIDSEKVLSLATLVSAEPGQIVSKTLAQNRAVSVTLFAFAAGEEIGAHESTGDAMATVLEGAGQFTIAGHVFRCRAGESIVMPPPANRMQFLHRKTLRCF